MSTPSLGGSIPLTRLNDSEMISQAYVDVAQHAQPATLDADFHEMANRMKADPGRPLGPSMGRAMHDTAVAAANGDSWRTTATRDNFRSMPGLSDHSRDVLQNAFDHSRMENPSFAGLSNDYKALLGEANAGRMSSTQIQGALTEVVSAMMGNRAQ